VKSHKCATLLSSPGAAEASLHTTNPRHPITLKISRKGSGLGIDFFGGQQGSAIRFVRAPHWRYSCSNATSALASASSYPRAPGVAGQNVVRLADVCLLGECFQNSLEYVDFALHVNADSSESDEYLPGYTVLLLNSSRICNTYVSAACTAAKELCQMEATNAWLAALQQRGAARRGHAAEIAGGTVAGAAALGALTGLAVWQLKRRRRRCAMRAGEDVELGNFG